MKIRYYAIALFLALAGCAKPPSQIAAAQIDPNLYRNMTCNELQTEARILSGQAAQAVGVQKSKADMDATMVGVGVVLFWPTLLFTSRDSAGEAAIATMRGRMNAIEIVAAEKRCGFTFEKV